MTMQQTTIRLGIMTVGLAALGGCDFFRWAENAPQCMADQGGQLATDILAATALCSQTPVSEGAVFYPAEGNLPHRRLEIMGGLQDGQHRLFLVSEGPLKDQDLPFAPSVTKTTKDPFGGSSTTTQSGCTIENRLWICSSKGDGGWDVQGLDAKLRVTDDGRNPGEQVDITLSDFRWGDTTQPGEGPTVRSPDGGTAQLPLGEQRLTYVVQEWDADGGVQGNP